jgi:glycolate oxidase FAD binding subunit
MAHGGVGAPWNRGECVTATHPIGVPASSTDELRDRVREAVSRRRTVRIAAGGCWLDANRPVRADETVATAGLSGIVEYEPGDLTITVRAGTTLDAIARATAEHGQWLALDPPGDATRATIGATIATSSYGPLAHHFGTPRDMALGVEFVSGTGDVARGGGRVVKNVAGFDLTRLVTGAWGSLGVLTEMTMRLRALPALQVSLALDLGATSERAEEVRRTLAGLPFVPLAAHWVDGPLSRFLGAASGPAVLVRLGGNEEAVRAGRAALEAATGAREVDTAVWDRLRRAEPSGSATVRFSRLPSAFATTWRDATRLVAAWPEAYCHGDAGRGTVRCVFPPNEGGGANLRAIVELPFDGTRVFERLPAELWTIVPPALRSSLERGIKAAFDPHGVLNPGILGETQ